ncbi:MAG: hypothetical protein DI536_26030 [Archangium gephyra]|uniref:RiboL-PSP-HEPN domain-containing protein n=1 Tax=Archangium gephyra TaxID=48 RepID=A0A2W5T9E7_9BACT|nr:MAG: hypothetical protein DI536_26030 [Archangium gephyra]
MRGAIAVLYAHWEGFIKHSSELYLAYLIERRHDYIELRFNFVALGLRSQLLSALQRGGVEALAKQIEFIHSGLRSRARFSFKNVVDTKSNLSVAVFKDIVSAIGLVYRDEFAVAEKPIIERLLELRNGIAHGEWRKVELSEFSEIYVKIDELLAMFAADLENAALNRSYLRT